MAKSALEKYLYQLKRIRAHRTAQAEKEIRAEYKRILEELQAYIGQIYVLFAQDDQLDYTALAQAGMDARFLEEVEQRISSLSGPVAERIREVVEETYEYCYSGMIKAIKETIGDNDALHNSLSSILGTTPEIIRRAVQNPVSGLTLNDTLESKRKEIIYSIKREIGVGLSNGDRYSTMARRISKSLDKDYKKSIRIVRTEAHRVTEAGNLDAALDGNDALGADGYTMTKTWRTMADERVRPNHRYKTKKGWKNGRKGKYDHQKMDGVMIPVDEMFTLPSGAKTMAPGQSGVAGEDINCRCYLLYKLRRLADLKREKVENADINDIIKTELETYNIKGVPKLHPEKIDVSGYDFDDKHINTEKAHGITRADAERFIKEADISLTRWNGKFINYYSPNGATYIDVERKLIRTSFARREFDPNTIKIREVADKYGREEN